MDQFYYESGYIDQSYFVYTADAESAQTITTAIACDASIIAGGEIVDGTGSWLNDSAVTANGNLVAGGAVAMNSAFEQSVMISHIEGADLFAMSNAALSAEVSRIRDNNTAATAVFSIATDASRTRNYSSDDSAAFVIVADNLRVRYQEAALDAAFSMTVDGQRVQKFASSLSAEFTSSVVADNLVKQTAVALSSTFSASINAAELTPYWINSGIQTYQTIATTDSGYVSVGYLGQIVKYDHYGNISWQKTIGGTSATSLSGVAVDSSGNIYVTGYTTAQGGTGLNILIAKFNSSGVEQWQKVSTASNNDSINSIAVDSSNNIYIAGGSAGSYPYIAKLDSSGTRLWDKRVSNPGYFYRIAIDTGDQVYAIAHMNTTGPGAYIVKFSTTGSILWQRGYGSTSGTTPGSIDVFPDGSGILLSSTRGSISEYIKINSSGSVTWVKQVPTGIEAGRVFVDESDNFYTVSRTSGFTESSDNLILTSYNFSGNINFRNQIINPNQYDSVASLSVDSAIVIDGLYYKYRLPLNGTGHGVYGDITYSAYTGDDDTVGSLSLSTPTYTLTTNTVTLTASTLSVANTNLSNSSIYYFNESVVVYGTGSLSSEFTQSATGAVNKSLLINCTSNSALTVSGGINKQADANLQSTGFTTVTVGRIRPFADIEVSAFSLSADAAVVKSSSADLSASSSQLATAAPLISVSVDIVTSSTLSSDVNRSASLAVDAVVSTTMSAAVDAIRANTIALQSQGFVVAAFGRIRPFVDIEVSSFNLAVDAFVGKVAAADLTVDTNCAVDATKQLGPVTADLSTAVEFVVYGELFPSGSVAMSVNSSMSADANRLRGFASQDTVTSTLGITQHVLRGFASALEISTDLTAVAYKILQFNSELTAFTAELSVINKIGNPLAHMPAEFTVDAVAKITAGVSIELVSNSSIDISTTVNKPVDVTMTDSAVMITAAESGIIGASAMTAVSTMSVSAITVQTATVNNTATTSLTASVTRIRPGISIEWAFGTVVADVGVIRQGAAQSTSTISSNVAGAKLTNGAAQLQCQGFELVIARVINLDASIIYVVPAENRIWTIVPETRVWTVPSETRTYTIKG